MTSLTLAGVTAGGTPWQLGPGERGLELSLQREGKPLKEFVAKRVGDALKADVAAAEAFLHTYCSLLERSGGFKVNLGEFSKLRELKPEVLTSAQAEESALLGFLLLKASLAHPKEGVSALKRLASISALSGTASVSLSNVPAMGTVTGLSLDTHLDFLDYLLNGELEETYASFHCENQGRVFPAHQGPNRTWGVDKEFSYRTLWVVVRRFLQLSRRSQKLKKLLYKLPHRELVNALDYDLPGTLLVSDTMELIMSLKGIEKKPAPAGRTYGYNEVNARFGYQITQELESTQKLDDFRALLGRPIITDDASPLVFYAHSFQLLGVAPTVNLLAILASETEGVSRRGFMELVRRGGFAAGEHPSWIATVLG